MAKRSNRSLSEWFGIDDPDIAFAFEFECSEILSEYELEKDGLVEAKQVTEMMAAVPKGFDTSKANRH